ncbi:recombinase family protein [Parablastomonas sp. CN1-191]|uniref:recombinase family protein n=1 Tax=Parablastomonas sp. CN1-191 TaxID=3400908 RepID=UPI003BF7BFDE
MRASVEKLASEMVRIHCPASGGADLMSAAGKMTTAVISAVAEFERDLLIERTQAGRTSARKGSAEEIGPPSGTQSRVPSGTQSRARR